MQICSFSWSSLSRVTFLWLPGVGKLILVWAALCLWSHRLQDPSHVPLPTNPQEQPPYPSLSFPAPPTETVTLTSAELSTQRRPQLGPPLEGGGLILTCPLSPEPIRDRGAGGGGLSDISLVPPGECGLGAWHPLAS